MPDPGDVVSWPQASVAVAVVIVLGVVPAVGGWLAARSARDTTRQVRETTRRVESSINSTNGGHHAKDQWNRIESKLDEHIATAARHDAQQDADLAAMAGQVQTMAGRISDLERRPSRRRWRHR